MDKNNKKGGNGKWDDVRRESLGPRLAEHETDVLSTKAC